MGGKDEVKEDDPESESNSEDESSADESSAEDENDQCPICTEEFSLSGGHKRITCPYCSYSACRQCVERVLIDPDANKDPECMVPSCRKTWSLDFIHTNFTKTFYLKELKAHRENVLFNREKALLPATQAVFETIIAQEREVENLKIERKALREEKRRIDNRLHDIWLRERALRLAPRDGSDLKIESAEKREFIRSCPAANCRGYLSTRWHCNLCDVWVCRLCHGVKGDREDSPHECKPEDVQSAELIMSETKPCPACGTRILKNGGCPQMFCTFCHKGFDWKTRKITTGPVHNPHYFEWMRQNNAPATAGSVGPCGGFNLHALRAAGGKKCLHLSREWDRIARFYNEVVANLVDYPTDGINAYLPIRLRYLKGELDEDQFKRALQMKEKRLSRLREEGDVLRMWTEIVGEELSRLGQDASNPKLTIETHDRLIKLREYVNDQLVKLSKRYNNVCKGVTKTWEWTNTDDLQGKLKKLEAVDSSAARE